MMYHTFPFRNKGIITQATGNDTEAGLHLLVSSGTVQLRRAASSPKAMSFPGWPASND